HSSLLVIFILSLRFSFFSNATATSELYTLSLHDALPILTTVEKQHLIEALSYQIGSCEVESVRQQAVDLLVNVDQEMSYIVADKDRKSTRLNSSHVSISYAVFCLKKKKNNSQTYCICDVQ